MFKHNDYSRFNIKGAFDGKISKVFEAGLSVNMAYTVQDDFSTDGTYCPYENAFISILLLHLMMKMVTLSIIQGQRMLLGLPDNSLLLLAH